MKKIETIILVKKDQLEKTKCFYDRKVMASYTLALRKNIKKKYQPKLV